MSSRKKHKILIGFLFIPLAILLAVPFSMLAPTTTAYAATNGSKLSDPEQVESWLYYQAIMQCLNSGVKLEKDASKLSSNQLFTSASTHAPALPYLRSALTGVGPDQRTNCDETNSQLTVEAFKFWGINVVDFICSLNSDNGALNVSRGNGRSCLSGETDVTYFNKIDGTSSNKPDANTTIANAFKDYLSKKVYGGGALFSNQSSSGASVDSALTDAQKYYFYYQTALKACVVKTDGTMPTQRTTKPDGSGVYSLDSMKQVDGKLTSITSYYIGSKNLGDTVSIAPNGYNRSDDNYELTCGEVQSKANAAIKAAINQIVTSGANESCTAANYVGPALSACILGASNKDQDEAWCSSRNWSLTDPNSTTTTELLVAACVSGLGLETNTEIPGSKQDCETGSASCSDTTSSCVIEGIGWIVCPVLNFLAGVTDATYGVVEGLLVTNASLVDTNSGTYVAWSAMRNIANVGFVIVFLVIIFSQLTSIGVSNYGVKKLLPRIIVAAILVNVSFIVSQLAVDLSNIIGGSLKTTLDNINVFKSSNSILATGNAFTTLTLEILGGQSLVAVTVVAGVAAYYAGLGLLIPILLAAVLAVIVTLFILVARQALVVILVVLSPFAFLAMLLPNTENYFKQWRKIFIALLLIYPAVALLFGGSHLAASILLNSFGGTSNTLGQLVAMAVMVLPLFVLPSLLKGSLNAVPAIGNFASKMSTRANGLVGKQGKQGFAKSTFGKSMAIRRQAKETYRSKRFADSASKQGSLANTLAKGPGITKAQKFANEAVERSVAASSLRAEEEEIKEAKDLISNANLSGPERQLLAMNGSITKTNATTGEKQTFSGDIMQRAAIQEQLRTGSYKDRVSLASASSDHSDKGLAKFAQTISNGVSTSGVTAQDPALSGVSIDRVSQGTFDYDSAAKDAIIAGKYTAQALATMHDDARTKVIKIAQDTAKDGDTRLIEILHKSATDIRASAEINGSLSNSELAQGQIDELIKSQSSNY